MVYLSKIFHSGNVPIVVVFLYCSESRNQGTSDLSEYKY
jgi:hypothetical protein